MSSTEKWLINNVLHIVINQGEDINFYTDHYDMDRLEYGAATVWIKSNNLRGFSYPHSPLVF